MLLAWGWGGAWGGSGSAGDPAGDTASPSHHPPLQPFTRPRRLAVTHPNISTSPLGLPGIAVRDHCKPILSTGKTKWGPNATVPPHLQRKGHGFRSLSTCSVPGTVPGSGGIRNTLHSQTVHRNREDVKHVNAITWGGLGRGSAGASLGDPRRGATIQQGLILPEMQPHRGAMKRPHQKAAPLLP